MLYDPEKNCAALLLPYSVTFPTSPLTASALPPSLFSASAVSTSNVPKTSYSAAAAILPTFFWCCSFIIMLSQI